MSKVVLITGAARRVGADIAQHLHAQGMNIVIHYRHSEHEANALATKLNAIRENSVLTLQADLLNTKQLPNLVDQAAQHWSQLDVLINNASSFYETKVSNTTEAQWEDLLASNLKAPFFLCQAAEKHLAKQQGCIINITDIHAEIPMKNYPVYSIAKAGLAMLTKSLAKELGPAIRVNAIAPGSILWPEPPNTIDKSNQDKLIEKTALKRSGSPKDIASTTDFLINHAPFITGQIIRVDGGL